jgi:broad specificity phosphatase PhoE
VEDELYYSKAGSDPEICLTDVGHTQAIALAELIARLFPPEHALTSMYGPDFCRIRQTLDHVEKKLSYRVERRLDARLAKRSYGNFWNLTHRGVQALYPEEYARYIAAGDLLYRAPGGGENYPDVFQRVEDFIASELASTTGHVFVGTHSVVALSFQHVLEDLPASEVLRQYEESSLVNTAVLVYWRDPTDTSSLWRPYNRFEPADFTAALLG